MKSNKLTIYMIKPDYQRLEDIVDSADLPIEIEGVGHFIFKESHPYRPDWVKNFFGTSLSDDLRIISSSARGLLVVPLQDGETITRFAVSFGTGRHLLKDGVIEDRFGLRVVLNSIDPENWRSIEKTTLGSVPKHSREQMARDVKATDFGIDIEQDLVSTITAKSKVDAFGRIITGKDALSLSAKIDAAGIKEFLAQCLERYHSEDYKRDFDWIDQIKDIRNKVQEARLNEILVQKLNNRDFEKLWMAVPEVIDWADTKGFRYIRQVRADLYDDLSTEDFLDTLGERELTADLLKQLAIFRVSASSDEIVDDWLAFRCLYAEIEEAGKLYLLNNGKWYEIAPSFTEQIKRHFSHMAQTDIDMPICEVNDEGAYNTTVAELVAGIVCLDKKLIRHGGGHSSIEFCDLITADRKIIHIKKYGGSNLLSHLFAQGIVSGELFAGDVEFREKVNEILPENLRLQNPHSRLNAGDYEVVYGIISKSPDPLEIPFFSKVSLRNAERRLSGYGYKVSLKKIQKVESPVSETA